MSAMGVPEQATPKSSRLKIVMVILAVLLVISAGGLAARYVYLHFFAPAQSTVTVPDNLIGEENSESQKKPAENSSQSEIIPLTDGESVSGQTDVAGNSSKTATRLRTSPSPLSWNYTRADRVPTSALK